MHDVIASGPKFLFFWLHRNESQQEAHGQRARSNLHREFRVQRPTQRVSKQLHTTTWGPRDPTPRTCQAGPPTTLAPATRTNVRSGVQFPLHLRRGSIPTSTNGLAGSSAAGLHIAMVGNLIYLPACIPGTPWGATRGNRCPIDSN